MQSETMSLAVAAGVAALILAFLHLASIHWSDSGKRPKRLVAYGCGTMALWIAFATWRLANGDWWTPIGLAIIDLAGGLAVILSYREDERAEKRERERKEAALYKKQAEMLEKADADLRR